MPDTTSCPPGWTQRYYVATDLCLADGRVIALHPLSRPYRKSEQALRMLERLQRLYPHAYVMESMTITPPVGDQVKRNIWARLISPSSTIPHIRWESRT